MNADILYNGYIVCGILAAGVGIGGTTAAAFKRAFKRHDAQQEERKQMREALVGTPATQWESKQIGLIEAMTQVQTLYSGLDDRVKANEAWEKAHEDLHATK